MINHIMIGTIISYITLFLGNFISLIYTPFMLARLGKQEYGLFSLTNTIISYVYLLDMGLSNAVIRYNAKYIAEDNNSGKQKLNGMFLLLYSGISIITSIVGVIIYKNIDVIFANGLTPLEIDKIKVMFLVALINLVLAFPLNVFNGIIIAHEKFIYTKLLAMIRTVLNPVIMIVVLVFGYKAIAMLIASSIFNVVLGLINVIYCFKVLHIKLHFQSIDKNLLIDISKFSFFIFLSAIAQKIYWSTDQFVLGIFVSSTAIAIYSIGSQLNGYFKVFSNIINGMFLPKLTKLTVQMENAEDKIMTILIQVSRIQYLISVFIFMGFILVGKQFVQVWVGEEYNQSYYIALLVMGPQLISIIQALFATLLEAMNKHRVKSLIYLGVAAFNLLLTLMLVKPLGALGCAFATSLGMLINALINNIYYRFKLKLNMKYYWRNILSLVPTTIGVFFIGLVLIKIINPIGFIDIALFILLFTLVYGISMWTIGINAEEKNFTKEIIRRINHMVFKQR